jgi:RNA polymerase sigma-54 factor
MRQLKAKGFNVARRTVTKYREKLDIPSSRQRRDWSKKKKS